MVREINTDHMHSSIQSCQETKLQTTIKKAINTVGRANKSFLFLLRHGNMHTAEWESISSFLKNYYDATGYAHTTKNSALPTGRKNGFAQISNMSQKCENRGIHME